MAVLFKGSEAAQAIESNILSRTPALYEKNIVPALAVVRVGENPSDIAYENGAEKKAKKLGLQVEKFTCPAELAESDVIEVIKFLNSKEDIHGILLLQPLPDHMDGDKVRNTICAEKDLDCISDESLAKLFLGDKEGYAPCTAESCIRILEHNNIDVTGKNVVVIGRSMVIGKPVASMLLAENATVTICHSRTPEDELKRICKAADIIVAAAGKAGILRGDMVSPGQTIIDVGINFTEDGKMTGDVDFEKAADVVDNITPVPGGVGSMTTTVLMEHLVTSCEKMARIK